MSLTPYHRDDLVTLYHGDCIEVMRALPGSSVDAVVTDPPYGLEFMGKEWDAPKPSWDKRGQGEERGFKGKGRAPVAGFDSYMAGYPFQEWAQEWATEALRVLKPGGHLLAFGGTRTWHRLACAIEDAGFEVRDSIAWMYGSGFPKSLDVSKAIDKAAGAEGGRGEMKRGGERLLNQTKDGARDGGGTWGDEVGRSAYTYAPATPEAARWQGWGTALKPAFEPIVVARKPLIGTVAQNVLAHGTGALNVDGCRIAGEPDRPTGLKSDGSRSQRVGHEGWDRPWKNDERAERVVGDGERTTSAGRWPANVILDESQARALDAMSGVTTTPTAVTRGAGGQHGTYSPIGRQDDVPCYGDTGGASRFFYTAKADSSERPRVDGVAHPTVKPLTLMRWLVTLVCPPGGVVLEPFAGSGTTLEACIVEDFSCIGIEREADYIPLIMQRITKPIEVTLL